MIHLKSQYSSPLDIPGVKELPPANKQGFCETMNMIWGRKSDGSELEPSQEPAEVVSLMPAAAAKGKEITKKATTPKTATAPKTAPKAAAASKAKKVSQEPAESKPLPLKSTREPQKRKYLAETEEEPVVKKPKAAAKPKPKPPSTSGSREFKRQTKTTQKKR